MAAEPAQAQSGLFYFVPTNTNVSTYTTTSGSTPTSTGTIGGGGATNAFMSLVRGDQAFAYQTYGGGVSDSLQVINTATQSVVQTVAMTQDPQGMAISPNGSTLYVANNVAGANTVFVFSVNATTGMLTQTGTINIGAGTRPRVLAVSPDGTTLYTADQGSNNVSVVNLATNTVATTIAVGTQPVSIAINPAGTRLYIGNASSANVTVINTATNAVVTTLSIGTTPINIAVSPNGQYFYVAAQGNNTVRIFDAATNAQIGTAGSASSPTGLVISPDGSTLYVTNNGSNNGQAFTIDPSTGLLTSLGFFAAGSSPTLAGMCGTGSSAGGMLGSGGTFLATSNGALSCAGSSATVAGGTILVGAGSLTMNTPLVLAAAGGTIDTNGNNTVLSGAISGAGGLTKTGLGVLTLSGLGTYTGATLVNMGTLQAGIANAFSASSAYTVASGAVLGLNGFSQTIGSLAGTGAVTLGGATLTTGNDNTSTTFSGVMSGAGGLAKTGSGTLTLAGTNVFTGGTVLNAGGLVVSGSLASGVTVNAGTLAVTGSVAGTVVQNAGSTTLIGGSLGGFTMNGGTASLNGTVTGATVVSAGTLGGNAGFGSLTVNGGTLAPGNSIGTFTVAGNFAQSGGIYQVEVNNVGQSDKIAVAGTAAISSGSTVQALAQPGNYGRSTTYTILTANGGVSGTYSGVTSNFAFLTPSLSYDANDVFLTLSMAENAFSFGGRTYNQRAVGRTLDQTFNQASGDYATVLNAIAGLGTANGPQTLDMISGQNYAGFGNAMVQGAQLFMSNFANRAGSRSGGGTKIALAEACDVACDTTTPGVWGAWGGAVGGTGTIAGNDNAGTFTYSVGGFSGGLDRRFGDNFLAGVTVGYQTGGQWTGGFDGRSVTDAVQAGLYGSFIQGPVYVDALAAYAYSANQLWRPINIAGLQPRTAYGQAGANQFLGQIESGWRFDLGGAPGYFVTPFALLQGSTATQNGLTETGAQSLNLSVAQQTTSSLRTIFGAQLGAAMDMGLRDRIAAQLRFGWSHEYSDTARPVTASFAGAPTVPFTVFGAAPTRDGAVVGFSVSTAIAEAMGVYLRYEGNIAGQDSSHALTAGLRMTW